MARPRYGSELCAAAAAGARSIGRRAAGRSGKYPAGNTHFGGVRSGVSGRSDN